MITLRRILRLLGGPNVWRRDGARGENGSHADDGERAP